jgi:hypothetical protein
MDSGMDDLYTPHVDGPIWRDVQNEEDEDKSNEDEKIRLGADNLFPFRRQHRK